MKKASQIMADLLRRRGYGRQMASDDVQRAWDDAVTHSGAGSAAVRSTQVGTLRRGTLQIRVLHSTVLQELNFHKAAILAHLKVAAPELAVRDLRFRAARVDHRDPC